MKGKEKQNGSQRAFFSFLFLLGVIFEGYEVKGKRWLDLLDKAVKNY